MAHGRARSRVWVFGCSIDPPPTPSRRASGSRMSTAKASCGALGGPFFDHFFALILNSILDSFWIRFGLVLVAFWEVKSGHVGTKMRLEALFFRKCRFSKKWCKTNGFFHLFDPQTRSKIDPRSLQDRSKSDVFFVLIFDSFWGRLRVVLGVVLGTKIDPKTEGSLIIFDLDFDLVVGWSQDSSKTVPRGLLEGSWVVLGGSWGRLGGVWGRSWALWGPLGTVLGVVLCRFGVRFVDSIHRFDSMLRFVDSCRLNSSARRYARSD